MSFKKLKMTRYFLESVLEKRPEFKPMEDVIIAIIDHPTKFEIQQDGRKKYFGIAPNGKFIRIILDGDQIHNVFYDSNFKG